VREILGDFLSNLEGAQPQQQQQQQQ